MNDMLGDLWAFNDALLNISERPQTHALDRGATGIGTRITINIILAGSFPLQI
jgi:hypothetical protein